MSPKTHPSAVSRPHARPLPKGLTTRIGYLLNRPALMIREKAEEILKPLGLIPPHFGVMATLEGEGPQTQRALGALLRVDPTTMVWLIDHLEKAGLVRRGEHPKDRRAHLVELSPAGKATYRKASFWLNALDEEFLSPLTKAERDDLRRLLTKLFQSVPAQTASASIYRKDGK
jgi:DNA-binding MarR family transcriptional regulator